MDEDKGWIIVIILFSILSILSICNLIYNLL